MQKLTFDNIGKAFPGVQALSQINLTIYPGEIHSICGENGAGKSTLMNVLTGNHQPDAGNILIDDAVVSIDSPQRAFDLGIAIVYQHLSLVDSLSIAENVYANKQPVNRFGFIQYGELHQQTNVILNTLGISLPSDTLVSTLSPAQKQMVEIAKALARNPSLLILDEPTASITEKETVVLFNILRGLKKQGIAILYISHRLHEIFALSDRVSVLKDGKSQGTFPIAEINREKLINLMVGRSIETITKPTSKTSTVLLQVDGLSGKRFNNISFQLHRGEILGFAGLIGSGRTETARAIFGADRFTSGSIRLEGETVSFSHPAEAIAKHLAYVPEERKSLGLFLEMSIAENIAVASLQGNGSNLYDRDRTLEIATKAKDDLHIATTGVQQKVVNLSGGNQQKVVIARWLSRRPDVLMLDEPTHGIDIGAKDEIYEIIRSLARSLKGIIVISSDLPELLGLSDRILVFREGSLAGEVERSDASEEKIMALAAN